MSDQTELPRVTQADFDKLAEIRAEIEEIRKFNREIRKKIGFIPNKDEGKPE